jgi:hypothetical protein
MMTLDEPTPERPMTTIELFIRFLGSPQRRVAILLVVIGAILRIWQYLANSSLWIDEAALARNIIDRPATALFGSLNYAQVAPIGFLLVEKAAVTLFGTSEYALRAFPLACGIFALFLFWRTAEQILSGWTATYAVGLFSLGMPVIYISSQVKQYSVDVAAAVLLLFAATEIRKRGVTPRRAWLLGITGALTVWFSVPSLIVLAGIIASFAIVVALERDTQAGRSLVPAGALCALSAAGAAVMALRSVTDIDRQYLQAFWGAARGFMPMPPRNWPDAAWLFRQLTQMFGVFAGEISGMGRATGGLNYYLPWVFTIILLAGALAVYRNRRDVALFLLLPVAFAAMSSIVKLYPFTGRVSVYLLPGLLLITAAGANHLLSLWPSRIRLLVPTFLSLLIIVPVYAAATALPPFWLQHLRPILENVKKEFRPGDAIYVYYSAGQAFHYYADRLVLPSDRLVIGRCAPGDQREYLRQVDLFRGRNRVWVIVTFHSTPKMLEAAFLVEYLDRIGRRLDRIAAPMSSAQVIEGAFVYLYDLSDSDRAGSVSWDTFPAPPALIAMRVPWQCFGVSLSEQSTDIE